MKTEAGYYIWNKGEHLPLGRHYTTTEFNCRCTRPECVEQRVSVWLVEELDLSREELRSAISVTNGFRCKPHQAELTQDPNVETVTNSQHPLGNAADITTHPLEHDNLYPILVRRFKAIGTGKRGYHVDSRQDKVRRWNYSKGL